MGIIAQFTKHELNEMQKDVLGHKIEDIKRKDIWVNAFNLFNRFNTIQLTTIDKAAFEMVFEYIKKNNG